MKKTYYIKTLGCKVNSYETEFIRSLFLSEGYLEQEKNADVYVINTCTVTNTSDKKSRKEIHSIRKNNPNSIVCAIGCFTQNKKEEINKYIDADIILGNKDKSKLLSYIDNFNANKKQIIKFYDMKDLEFEDMEIKEFTTQKRAFIKIQDGCNNYCSYCIIPFVRGNVRSKKKETVISEAKALVKNGHKEIVLSGIHTGQYGSEFQNYKLSNLLYDLCKIDNLLRIRISSIEIVEINDEIINLLKTESKIVSHLHIPLQSGSERILDLMNRRYNKEYFKNKILEIKNARPDISITTDIIVGFPTETEEEFLETIEFAKEIKFTKIHVFPYSDRDGTLASKIKIKTDPQTKKERVKRLMELSNTLENEYYKSFIGKKVDVLIEEEKDGYKYGYTTNYIPVKLKGNAKENSIINMFLDEENIVGIS